MEWLLYDIEKPNYRALVIRRNSTDLSDWIDRAVQLYTPMGAKVTGHPATITFPSGAIIRTGHLNDDQAYTKYMGHEYQKIVIEEATQIPDEVSYLKLISACRTTDPTITPQVFLTTNPGGIGHNWIKKRFIDIAPPMTPITKNRRTFIYIPATVDDNPYLYENDPQYLDMLDALKDTDEQLWKAWRLGDWNVFAGMFFKTFRPDIHVVPAFNTKEDWVIEGGIDWGMTAPFVVLLAGIERVNHSESGRYFNRLHIYREITGTETTPIDVGKLIIKQKEIDRIKFIYADPSIFNRGADMGEDIASQMSMAGKKINQILVKADNNRKLGLATIHQWLSMAPDGKPYIQISNQCVNLINQLGSAVYDEKDVEDIDDTPTDNHHWDCLDAGRYLCRGIKWIDAKPLVRKTIPAPLIDKVTIVTPVEEVMKALLK